MGHDTPVSDQVSDNGTEHSGISVPGPGRLATGKIIKRRPSEVLRDEEVAGSNPVTPTSGMPGQIHIEILDRSVRAASTAAKYSSISVQDVCGSGSCLTIGFR